MAKTTKKAAPKRARKTTLATVQRELELLKITRRLAVIARRLHTIGEVAAAVASLREEVAAIDNRLQTVEGQDVIKYEGQAAEQVLRQIVEALDRDRGKADAASVDVKVVATP